MIACSCRPCGLTTRSTLSQSSMSTLQAATVKRDTRAPTTLFFSWMVLILVRNMPIIRDVLKIFRDTFVQVRVIRPGTLAPDGLKLA